MTELDLIPVWISLKTAATATIITFCLGIAAARWMAGSSFRGKSIIDALFILPLVLPPTVVGFGLLLLFGRNGPIGQVLMQFDRNVIFSWSATVIASTVVAFPLMYQATLAALEQIQPNIEDAARTLGASEWVVFHKITIPLAWPGIAAGTILAFARSLGEFGATLMLAGNIPGKTQTIPLAIYFAVEAGHNSQAVYWVLAILMISLASIAALNYWKKRQYSGNGSKFTGWEEVPSHAGHKN
ncbi:MAG: molybdate ABC transporter permease subunit [Syntrophomonadaceae bacterium]|nr:molybdate ABC transporter permease subunit [Syntrophomonadaceae bacterium]MDD3023646.1 molybdate ABC transporter permease subunit [Syntrophomonadaceae bacterium]